MRVELHRNGRTHRVDRKQPGNVSVTKHDGVREDFAVTRVSRNALAVDTEAGLRTGVTARDGNTVWVHWEGRAYRLELRSGSRRKSSGGPGGGLAAPMPGQVLRHLVREGTAVKSGDPLLVVEAMKMQLEIKAVHAGTVKRILVKEGDQVEAGIPLVELEETP